MLQVLKKAFLCLMCLNLVSCIGQTPKDLTKTLSNDFDKSMPFYYGMPQHLLSTDTSPGYKQNGQKILLTGTVYQNDGKTPAPNVILYYYHTDINGIYAINENEERNMPKNNLGQTHGYIRGWLKTDKVGKYSIYTVSPETYPSRDEPAHIHVTLKDNYVKAPYYIDDFVFDNDPLLISQRRKEMENRGGSGVIRFVQKENMWVGERNIILGLNIPEYPLQNKTPYNSGKNIGEDIMSFTPFHAYGEDKGTKTCPICKYGWYHGILYFVGNKPNWKDIKEWLIFFDNESVRKAEYLKVYFIYGNEADYDEKERIQLLKKLGNALNLKKIALTFVPSFSDKQSKIYLNQINPDLENTILIYKRSNIIDKYINLKPNEENFKKITRRLNESTNQYFELSRPKH